MLESQTHDREHAQQEGEHIEWLELGRIGFVGLAIIVTWLRLWQPLPHFDIAGFAAVLIGGYPIFHEAFADLLSRRMTMELSMTIALVSALATLRRKNPSRIFDRAKQHPRASLFASTD